MTGLLYYLRILSQLLPLVKHFFSGFFVDFSVETKYNASWYLIGKEHLL